MPMTFGEENRRLTALVSGEIDHHGARGMMLALDRRVAAATPNHLTIDLSGVTFMDSSGIAILLRAWKRMGEVTGGMEVVGIPPQAAKMLKAAGLQRIIPMDI